MISWNQFRRFQDHILSIRDFVFFEILRSFGDFQPSRLCFRDFITIPYLNEPPYLLEAWNCMKITGFQLSHRLYFTFPTHLLQPFLVWIFGVYFFFESIIFPASREHARRCYLSRKSMKSCLVSPQLLKNCFTTSGLQDSNSLPSMFDSQHRSFGWNHKDLHQFWLVKMVTHQKNFYMGIAAPKDYSTAQNCLLINSFHFR